MDRLVWFAALFAGCSFSGPSGFAPDPADAGPGADAADTADAGRADAMTSACEAGDVECADLDTLATCRLDGSGFDEQLCDLGCLASPAPHCATFVPSNGVRIGAATAELDTGDRALWIFDTDTGEIADGESAAIIRLAGTGLDPDTGIGFELVAQPGAPRIGVFQFAALRVADGTTIRGIGGNALAIAVRGTLEIAGVVDVRGGAGACAGTASGQRCAGPGGFTGGVADTAGSGPAGSGGGPGENEAGESGGGGGGHGLGGGSGGEAEESDPGDGGDPFGSSDLTPLRGGAGGGGGGTELGDNCLDPPPHLGGAGGGGGGAVQLVAARIVLDNGDGCGVNGGGGGGSNGGCNAGGGGGGAGGAILIEASVIDLDDDCVLAANGGGGGAASSPAIFGTGEDGRLSTAQANGGFTFEGSNGGDGGTDTPAQDASDHSGEAGGGGGGAGRIRINSLPDGRDLDGDISPTASVGTIALE